MTFEEKEQLSKKISFFIAGALELKRINIEAAGRIAQICIRNIDTTDSISDFKIALQNESDQTLSSFIDEIYGIL